MTKLEDELRALAEKATPGPWEATMDVEKIANGLTKAQRAMLIDIADGKPREYSLGQTGFALDRQGLVFVNELGARHLTDEGHAVRAYLVEKG
jgi:hypothetical protein